MSAILEPRNRIALRERSLPDFDTAVAQPRTRPQRRTKSRRRASGLAIVVGFSTKLALTSLIAYGVSVATCQYMFEQARRDAISAKARAEQATAELAGLRREIDHLQSAERIQTWASLNGLTPSYLAANGTTH